ncbi:MAG: hypothetical protein IJF54_02110 [Clostridia bacterium]|nr:hypothetical protein [Clostridia bacterium]
MIPRLIKLTIISVVATIAAITITLDSAAAKDSAQNPSPHLYLMKESDGKIAIYKYNTNVPFQVLDVYVDSLPEADRELLKQGINADSKEQLSRLIEDYDG